MEENRMLEVEMIFVEI